MNKFKLFIISGLLTFFGITSFCSADKIEDLITFVNSGTINHNSVNSTSFYHIDNPNDYGTYCIKFLNNLSIADGNGTTSYVNFGFGDTATSNANTYLYRPDRFGNYICIYVYKPYLTVKINKTNSSNNRTFIGDYEIFKLNTLLDTNIPQYTSLQCQTEYNLIPIENITANYCKINFDLIDPSECQGNSTGETIYSNLYINNTRYPGASNIYLRTNDNLGYTYNNTGGQIEVNVDYNVDEDYLIDVINKEKLTPTNTDFENLINGLQYYLPYIMVALLLGRTVYVLKKVFRF